MEFLKTLGRGRLWRQTLQAVTILVIAVCYAGLQTRAQGSEEGTSNADANDILNGRGIFANPGSFEEWEEPEEGGEIELVNGIDEKFIKVRKSETEEVGFTHGFTLEFEAQQAEHLRFYFSATNVETEQANLRLKDVESGLTAVSFRCGNAGFVRVNDNQMVDFYNASVSGAKTMTPTWRKADIVMDWVEQAVRVYLDDQYYGDAKFYHKNVTKINQIMIYNLRPDTVSYFKDIELCNPICADFSSAKRLIFTAAAAIIALIALLV